jgi:SNF2 family DNA or RNA helicase
MRFEAKSYQKTAIEFLLSNEFAALWLDMGLGKTITVLTAICRLLLKGRANRILIVAPLRVAVQTWPTEIRKWDHTRDLQFTVIRASGDEPEVAARREMSRQACRSLGLRADRSNLIAQRAANRAMADVKTSLLYADTPIHIVNQESLFWLVKHFGSRFPYDTVIFDESSGLRDHKSDRYRAMLYSLKHIKRHWQLTGTPAPESYLGLFTQVYLLDRGERFGKVVTNFRERYFTQDRYSRAFKIKPGAENEIIDALQGIVLDMKAVDYNPIQPSIFIDREIDLTKREQAIYDKLENEMVLTFDDGSEAVAETAGALAQKLLQFASGAVYDTERNYHSFHDHKIEELKQVIAEAQGKPVLVAYWFKSSLSRLKAAFPKAVAMDKAGARQHDWNAGKIDLMLMQPRSGGHGLNLQDGGHILVWFDICYPLEAYEQMNARLARQGQKESVRIYHLIVRNTLDAFIVPRLAAKEASQSYLFNRLKWLRQRATKRKDEEL